MSSTISTRDELSSNRKKASGRCWRVVEAQNQISTTKLTDTSAEQHALELLIEETKPPVPAESRHLNFLLSTPFRYGAAYPRGSRFRRAGFTPGVFYASERVETAIAELCFFRLLFFSESPDTKWPANAGEYTAFATKYATDKIDRSDIAAVRFPVGAMDASDRLRALPDSRRDGARSRRRIDQIRFGARPGAPSQSCDPFLPGVRAQRAGGPSNMATAFRQQRRARGLRIAAPHARFQQDGLSGRPAYRIDELGAVEAQKLMQPIPLILAQAGIQKLAQATRSPLSRGRAANSPTECDCDCPTGQSAWRLRRSLTTTSMRAIS